jgi:transcriptional regulator with XRE-family HTH domain
MIPIPEQIVTRREELGLSEVDVAEACGMSIYEYGDVEAYDNELVQQVDLSHAKRLCRVLNLDFLTLVGAGKDTTDRQAEDSNAGRMLRNEIFQQARLRLGLSVEHVADVVGYEPIAIESIETDPNDIETRSVKLFLDLCQVLQLDPRLVLE